MLSRPQQPLERGVDTIDITVVGNHDQGAASRCEGGPGRDSHRLGPVAVRRLTGQCQP